MLVRLIILTLLRSRETRAMRLFDSAGAESGPDLLRAVSELASLMLSDEEAEDILERITTGVRGPVLLKWLERLLQDREERRQRERGAEPPRHIDK